MKKIYLQWTIAAFFIFVMMTTSSAAIVSLGGKIGFGMGWWRGSSYEKNLEDADGKLIGAFDFVLGPYCDVDLHKYVSLQAEFLFTFIGNADEYEILGAIYEQSYRNVGFEIPIYIKPKFPIGPGNIFILFGPELLILLDDFTHTGNLTSATKKSHVSLSRQLHFGLACGLGYDLKLGPGMMQFAFSITPYLTNYGDNFDRALQNEFTFQVGYAYTFR
jgi:hypothetical protein